MWKWVYYSADFHRLEYFQDFGDGKLLVGQSNKISEIWKNALEEDPEHPSLPQDDWWLLIKLCFSHLLHSDLRLLIIVWFTTKMIFFYCDFLMKIINLYLSNFKMTNSFILDFHEVGISYFPVRGHPYTALCRLKIVVFFIK